MREKIIAIIEDVLDVPRGTVTRDTMADDLDEWDSMAMVLIMGELADSLGIHIPVKDFLDIKGVRDILRKAGIDPDD